MADRLNGFKFDGPKLDDFDFPRIGAAIGVGEDIIHAVLDTETAGKSTDSKGRLKALYEPHVAYRNAKGAARDKLVAAGLAYRDWKRSYPKDSYPRIDKARAIDETAALKGTSWGFPQIIGENHDLAGYDTVQDMVEDFLKDEDNQIEAMVRFIKNAGLDDELRVLEKKLKSGRRITADDCRAFVRGYNGAGYAKNNYHTIFAGHLNKWAKIQDTKWEPDSEEEAVPPRATGDEDVTAEIAAAEAVDFYDGKFHIEIEAMQKRLNELGYPEFGKIDGKWGTKTRAAMLAFRADKGLPLVPVIDDQLLAALMVASPRYINPARANATVADLRAEGAEDVKVADNTQIAGTVAASVGVAGGAAKLVEQFENYGGMVQRVAEAVAPIQEFIASNFWLLAIAVGGIVIWQTGVLKRIRLVKHQTGEDVSA